MHAFDPQFYGPVFAPLLAVDRRRPLDAGTPESVDHAALKNLSIEAAFVEAGQSVKNQAMAECCLAGVWLLHDFLDESHTISQSIDTPTGSFWHGIMHRREGDFSNAKYWFRRVGVHPVFEPLAQRAAELAAECGAEGPPKSSRRARRGSHSSSSTCARRPSAMVRIANSVSICSRWSGRACSIFVTEPHCGDNRCWMVGRHFASSDTATQTLSGDIDVSQMHTCSCDML